MIRLLHVVETEPDFQTSRSTQHLEQNLGEGFAVEVRRIGPGGDWRSLPAAVVGLRRRERFGLVHAWGTRALTAAALGTNLPLVYSPPLLVQNRMLHWLRAVLAYRAVQVVSPTATLQRGLVSRGVPLDRCHLIRPGVDFGRIRRRRDPRLRAELGLSDQDIVVLAAGESTAAAAHEDAAWATAILHVLDPRWKLLLWGRGPHIPAVQRFQRRLNNPQQIRLAEQRLSRSVEFEDLLPAADMVLNTAKGSVSTLPIAIAMAAALPVVSTVTHAVCELLEDHHTALLVPKRSPRLLAQRLLELREDAALQWRLTDIARTEAYEYFPLTRFLDQYRTLYRQVAAGQAVEIPEPAAGAGSRFHGRVPGGAT